MKGIYLQGINNQWWNAKSPNKVTPIILMDKNKTLKLLIISNRMIKTRYLFLIMRYSSTLNP